MVIRIHSSHTNLNLKMPTALALNGFAAAKLAAAARRRGYDLTEQQARTMIRAVRDYRRTHPEWVLAEISSSDGHEIFIQL